MKATAVFILALAATGASAQSFNLGEVRNVRVAADGAQTFRLYEGFFPVQVAACATAGGYAIVDASSSVGRAQMALLIFASTLPANNSGTRVQGLGTCTRVEGYEDVDWIEVT